MRVGALLPGVAVAGVLVLQGCGGDDPVRTVTVTAPGAATTPATGTRTTASVPTTTERSRPRTPRTTTTTAPRPRTVAENTTVERPSPPPPPPSTTDREPASGADGTAEPETGTFDPVGGTTAARGRADGTGYSVRVPSGWNDGAKRFEGSSVAFDRTYVKGRGSDVTSSILVVRSTPSGARRGIAGLEGSVRRQIAAGAGGADVQESSAPRIDGEAALAFVVRRSLGDTAIVQRQIAVVRDGALFIVGLTAARRTYEADARTFARFLASWRWTDAD